MRADAYVIPLASPMPATYRKHGVEFLYPDNWELKDRQDEQLPYQVSLETPEGGIWTLSLFPAEEVPRKLLDQAAEALEEQYEDVEWSPWSDGLGVCPAIGREANFFCLDFVVTAHLIVFSTEAYQLVVWYQAESRDFERQRDVFLAVAASLLQSCRLPAEGN